MNAPRSLAGEIRDLLGGYIRGQILIWAISTALYAVGFRAIHAPAWYALAILLPLLDWIPHLGPVLGLALTAAIALMGGGDWNRVLMALGVWLVVETISSYVLQPRIIGKKLGLSPLVVFAVSIAGGFVLGPVGFLLAAPVAAVLAILWRRVQFRKREIPISRQ